MVDYYFLGGVAVAGVSALGLGILELRRLARHFYRKGVEDMAKQTAIVAKEEGIILTGHMGEVGVESLVGIAKGELLNQRSGEYGGELESVADQQ